VDGRPLSWAAGGEPLALAGLRPPGPAETPKSSRFTLELDPGFHVFTFLRKGFSDGIVRRQLSSGKNPRLEATLDRLPATIRVRSSVAGALVELNDEDLGPAPVVVRRPAGDYTLKVRKDGFATYQSVLSLDPGQESTLRADLVEEESSVLESWWFWTGAAALIAGASVGTYFLVRDSPDPVRADPPVGNAGQIDVTPQFVFP
ncbi:MAG: PEGA domain-containing protein, partial [Myxococcota bacterium]